MGNMTPFACNNYFNVTLDLLRFRCIEIKALMYLSLIYNCDIVMFITAYTRAMNARLGH